jgi:DNA-binding transcriptional regulator LsrR (DeoR family)
VSFSKTLHNTNEIVSADDDMYDVKLYNVSGKLVEQSQHAGNEFFLDMTHQLNGMYFLKMKGTKNSFTKTIFKN